MARGGPSQRTRLTDEERDQIADAIRAGKSRNEIARAFDRSAGTVTKIAKDRGLEFDRSLTADATRARQADAARLRAEIEAEMLAGAFDSSDADDTRRLKKLAARRRRALRRAGTRPRLVYFIQGIGGGPIKIGVAESPALRLRAMQPHSPVHLQILLEFPGGFTLERELHKTFASSRLHGEWFDPTPQLLSYIDRRSRASTL